MSNMFQQQVHFPCTMKGTLQRSEVNAEHLIPKCFAPRRVGPRAAKECCAMLRSFAPRSLGLREREDFWHVIFTIVPMEVFITPREDGFRGLVPVSVMVLLVFIPESFGYDACPVYSYAYGYRKELKLNWDPEHQDGVGAPNNRWLNPINKKFHASNGLPLYDMMYERRCKTPICWEEVQLSERYEVRGRLDLDLDVGDDVLVKVSPWEVVNYRLQLPSELSQKHIPGNASWLRKYLVGVSFHDLLTTFRLMNDLTAERSIAILEMNAESLRMVLGAGRGDEIQQPGAFPRLSDFGDEILLSGGELCFAPRRVGPRAAKGRSSRREGVLRNAAKLRVATPGSSRTRILVCFEFSTFPLGHGWGFRVFPSDQWQRVAGPWRYQRVTELNSLLSVSMWWSEN
ncbi:hypothetical protein OSB04_016527 [Centaurea solstitialis]|uniref:Uncharacterized protein n=1 Tax=Centaurea solstitialis TaxID=347529 RepID=A0AA38W9W2_9ASTR|nr:hypothetical protein OSB04_016527 [Centaurea solstitialis]